MTDKEFKTLQDDIAKTMSILDRLQQLHITQTGRRFVPPMTCYCETAPADDWPIRGMGAV